MIFQIQKYAKEETNLKKISTKYNNKYVERLINE